MSALVWTRPWGFVAWLLPIAVILLARRTSRAPLVATGTLEIWQRVAAELPSRGRRARRPLPPAAWCAVAALALGAFALCGPSWQLPPGARTWRVVLDRRPAMFLRDGSATRIERAVALARAWLDEHAHEHDDVEWIALVGPRSASRSGRAPPAEWLRAPRVPLPAPDWSAVDREDAVWVSDGPPATAPRHAGLVLSGGRAIPGPIGASGTTRWDWDGERVVAVPHGVGARTVRIDGALVAPIERVLRIWASERGLSIDAGSSADVALRVISHGDADVQPAHAARDGWWASVDVGAAPSSDDDGELETWLSAELESRAGGRRAALTRGPGRIDVALVRMQDPAGDPAAFAVSMAELFDACLLPPPDVVALRDRASAGEARVSAPLAVATGSPAAEMHWRGAPLDAWFALAALAAALAAVAIASTSLRGASVRRRAAAADRLHQSA